MLSVFKPKTPLYFWRHQGHPRLPLARVLSTLFLPQQKMQHGMGSCLLFIFLSFSSSLVRAFGAPPCFFPPFRPSLGTEKKQTQIIYPFHSCALTQLLAGSDFQLLLRPFYGTPLRSNSQRNFEVFPFTFPPSTPPSFFPPKGPPFFVCGLTGRPRFRASGNFLLSL